MKKRPIRIALATAGLAAASLLLSGCLYAAIPEQASSNPSATREPDTEGVTAELRPFYDQTLDWSDCGAGFDCTSVKTPLDWENPASGKTMELSVVRSRATGGEAIGSLLTNPGGPGASGVSFVRDNLEYVVGADLIENYDVIGFDPRGVGKSTAVTCFDASNMDKYLYDIPASPRGTQEWEDELLTADRAFADACKANSGDILPYITTVNAARDMDVLRAVLGDKQLNYLGYSYGTFLGATYAKLYPDKAGRLVFDGAIDPSTPGSDVSVAQALGFESALRTYMQDCLDSAECSFSGTVDDAMTDLGVLLASADRSPMKNGDGRELGADTLLTGIVAALYSQESWPYLTDGLTKALEGDPSVMFFLADSYNSRQDGVYTDNSTEAFTAYNCMDYPVEDDEAVEAAMKKRIAEGAPTVAPYWTGPDSCSVWPYPPTGKREQIRAAGAGPIVVVGTTNDPATPYAWSKALADQLEEGVLVTRVGEGHTGYNKGNNCVDDAVEAFLIDDVVPKDGLRCG